MPDYSWKQPLAELEQTLERHTSKLDVLRKIDESVFRTELKMEEFLYNATDLLRGIYDIKHYEIYGAVDNSIFPLRHNRQFFDNELIKARFLKLKKENHGPFTVTSVFKSKQHVLCVIPFVLASNIFWVFDSSDADSDFSEYAKNFGEQLATFVRYFAYRQRREAERRAYEVFFDSKLQPAACWAGLLNTLASFLPHPLFANMDPPQVSQLLTYLNGDTLRIAAGQGSGGTNFVLVNESISGMVLKVKETDYLLLNPQKFKKLYKGYGSKKSETELVIRLDSDKGAVAIINIEHQQKHAFNSFYVQCMRDAARFLSPLVAGLQARYESFRKKEIGLLYIFTDMLSRMGDTYSHLIAQPILDARNTISEIRYQAESNGGGKTKELLSEINLLGRSIDDLEARSEQFTSELPEFVSFGPQPVKARIEQRLKAFKKLIQAETIHLTISEELPGSGESLRAFASALFQEHVFNIVNNSFQQIRKRIFEGDATPGSIRIHVARTSGLTNLKQATGVNFIDITISDNGGGALPKDLEKIGRPGFTTKEEHGSGFGVSAAKEYFESIGGDMTWRNYKDGFQTTIRMQEFKPGLHDQDTFMDKLRAEAQQ